MFDHGVNLNNFNIDFQKIVWWWGSFDSGLRDANYTKQHNVWLWGLVRPLKGMEVIING